VTVFSVNTELLATFGLQPGAFEGRTALVTGSARGIGEATATTLAHLGATVIVLDVRDDGEAVARAITNAGGRAEFVRCDLSDVAQLEAAATRIEETYGGVDILVNNALHIHAAPVVALDLGDWELTYATNARAPFLLIKRFLPGMLERRRGTIVNMIAYEG
jgi:NAD(P)-dependent dehydrogenase (short-subunit alcohol dehydrogenase family)